MASNGPVPVRDPSAYPGWPRWAKLQLPFVALLLAVVVAMSTGLGHDGGDPASEAEGAASGHVAQGGQR